MPRMTVCAAPKGARRERFSFASLALRSLLLPSSSRHIAFEACPHPSHIFSKGAGIGLQLHTQTCKGAEGSAVRETGTLCVPFTFRRWVETGDFPPPTWWRSKHN